MIRLAFILYLFIGVTFAGVAMIAALASGNDTATPLIWAAVIGAVVAMPVTWLVAKALYRE